MVVGGYPSYYDVEVINLSGDGKTCLKLANHPMKSGSVGMFFDGYPLVCGGSGATYDSHFKECYKYNAQVWDVCTAEVYNQ